MTPKQIVMNMINKNNPVMGNLLQMAENNQVEELKTFGRNLYKEKGGNFDKEYSDFLNCFNKR